MDNSIQKGRQTDTHRHTDTYIQAARVLVLRSDALMPLLQTLRGAQHTAQNIEAFMNACRMSMHTDFGIMQFNA